MFYAIKNLRSSTVFEVPEPWKLEYDRRPPAARGKDAVDEWNNDPTTDYAFISGYEGPSSLVRVSDGDNPIHNMHALIADIDIPQSKDAAELLVKNAPNDLLPQWLVKTPSGNSRLIWIFEKPMLVGTKDFMASFRKQLYKQLKVNRWLGEPDVKSWNNPATYFSLGTEWTPINPDGCIPSSRLELWFVHAAHKMKFDHDKVTSYSIPYEDLAREAEARFPGRWKGLFAEGARGVRFWDPSADNETAAVVTPDGMICYTGDRFFVSWKSIFGGAFVDAYETSYIAGIIENSAYDGREFWLRSDGDRWTPIGKTDFTQHLKTMGYDPKTPRGETKSEVDVIEHTIKMQKRVRHAMTYLYQKPGIIPNPDPDEADTNVLNTSKAMPIGPAAPEWEGGMTFTMGKKYFPFVYKLLTSLFGYENDEGNHQLQVFLGWLRYFYQNARAMTPQPGHALVVAGGVGKGKTLLFDMILAKLMGAAASDGTKLLLENCQFTASVAKSPMMLVDDAQAAADYQGNKTFAARVKKYTANSKMNCNEKYMKAADIPWFGRVVILCNLDAESLKVVPSANLSNKDKLIMLKTSEPKMVFPGNGKRPEIARIVDAELPYFAAYLTDSVTPPEIEGEDARFGMAAYHHPDLLNESEKNDSGGISDIVSGSLERYFEINPAAEYWEGQGLTLYEDMCELHPNAMRKFTQQSVCSFLGKLAAQGKHMESRLDKSRRTVWKIYKDVYDDEKEES